MHIKAFAPRSARPQAGQRVSFEVERNPQGKKRARNVQYARPARASRQPRHDSPAQWGSASYFVIPAFLALWLAVALAWRVPGWVALLYLIASIVCFFAYHIDKLAAGAGKWRVSEENLHFLALAGGWPGALVAQQWLRHKTIKREFRAAFWSTVVCNVLAFVLLNSPLTAGLRASGFGLT